jgi:hypothetical protein
MKGRNSPGGKGHPVWHGGRHRHRTFAGSASIKISHSVTSDIPDGRPWPAPDRKVLWAVVRRAGATPRPQLLKSGNCDRAAVVTTALLQIILSSSTPPSGLRQHLEELLRDEFEDIKRQAAADRADVDA